MYINSWKYLQPQKWIGNISFGAFKEKLRDPKYKSGNIFKLKKIYQTDLSRDCWIFNSILEFNFRALILD